MGALGQGVANISEQARRLHRSESAIGQIVRAGPKALQKKARKLYTGTKSRKFNRINQYQAPEFFACRRHGARYRYQTRSCPRYVSSLVGLDRCLVHGISLVSAGSRYTEYRTCHWSAHLNTEPTDPLCTDNIASKSADWDAVRAWRKDQRERLLIRRMSLSSRHKNRVSHRIVEILRRQVALPDGARLGFYWPLNGEIDLRPLIRDLLSRGAKAALPVIINKDQPLEFWEWDPNKTLYNRGLWSIPAPKVRKHVRLSVLLIPLLGFDGHGHRLGHDNGYYDRTLATIRPKPLTIGIGYEFGRLDTVHPQPHDVPLDAIVTETGVTWFKGSRCRRK